MITYTTNEDGTLQAVKKPCVAIQKRQQAKEFYYCFIPKMVWGMVSDVMMRGVRGCRSAMLSLYSYKGVRCNKKTVRENLIK